VDGAHQRRRGGSAEHLRRQLAGLAGSERRERQLVEAAVAAQLVAKAPQRVIPRQAVAAVRGDHQERQPLDRRGEPGEQLEGGVVGPLEVVEDEERRAVVGDLRERASHRLEQRGPVTGRRGAAELGQDQREVRAQRAQAGEAVRAELQVGPQRGGDRAVRRRGPLAGAAAQDQAARVLGQLVGEARLAHPRLAREQEDGAAPEPRPLHRAREPLALGRPADERAAIEHRRSVGAAGGRGGRRRAVFRSSQGPGPGGCRPSRPPA
jgi:hypothetical protein